jgi:TolA-binding protein
MKKMKLTTLTLALWFGASALASTTSQVMNEQSAANKEARDSQGRVDNLDDETRRLLDEYASVLSRTENMRVYNQQLQRYINSQEEEKVSIRRQIEQVTETNHGIVPLMIRMLDSLEQFVALDVPFLNDERKDRLTDLRSMMDRADVSTSEKYRRILEAFQIENEYGRTIEVYRGPITVGGNEMTVDFLRIGRVALMYQTLDGRSQAYWNDTKKAWEPLSSSYSRPIRDGIRIARQQAAPDLIKIPVLGPERI